MTGSNGSSHYKVVSAAILKERIAALHLEAAKHGLGAEFLDALRKIYRALEKDPRGFGDPHYRLPALRLTVYMRANFPVAVDYGVHDKLPLVIIRGFRLML